MCKCGFCGTEKLALSDWERHTGSKLRNWRTSVRVKGSMLPLEQWVRTTADFHNLFIFLVIHVSGILGLFIFLKNEYLVGLAITNLL